ncbi:MAG: F0F1 ATP synthase subunit A [Candidatus Shapirobacteria bacterium]
MDISLSPETILTIGHLSITNSLFSGLIIITILSFVLLNFRPSATNPTKLQLAVEAVYLELKKIVEPILGDATTKYFPLLLTFFILIISFNWFGLLPITGTIGFNHNTAEGTIEMVPFFRAPTSDLSATLALALISVLATNFIGLKSSGIKFFKRYFDFSKPLDFFVSTLELISELGKNFSFAFRLFGNIFAGEVVLLVITSLTYGLATLPFFGLELFIGLIQAFVFFMLTSIFIKLAIKKH